MKKFIIFSLVGLLFSFSVILINDFFTKSDSFILATSLVGDPDNIIGSFEPDKVPESNFSETIERMGNWLWVILLITAVLFIIIAAYFFVTAAGNSEQIKKGRDMILYAVIAIIVAAAAYGIVSIVRSIVEGRDSDIINLGDSGIPDDIALYIPDGRYSVPSNYYYLHVDEDIVDQVSVRIINMRATIYLGVNILDCPETPEGIINEDGSYYIPCSSTDTMISRAYNRATSYLRDLIDQYKP